MSESSIFPAVDFSGCAAFLYYDSLPVGAIAVAVLLGTSALLHVAVDGPLLVLGFCGTALVYLADRGLGMSPEDRINRPERLAWIQRHQPWLWGEGALLVLGIAISAPLLEWGTIVLAIFLGALGALHSGLLFGGRRRLKAGSILKPVVVCAAWAIGAGFLPVVEAGEPITLSVVGLTAYRFVLILPNVLLADWIDREGDARVGSGTWARGWSRHTLLLAASILHCVGLLGAVLVAWFGGGQQLLLLDAVGGGLLLIGVWRLRPAAVAGHMFLLDAMVAWPIVPWVASILWG